MESFSRLIVALAVVCSVGAQTVKVGSYIFPPYFEKSENGKFYGVIPDFLAGLNKFQKAYRFEVFETSPKRRYQDFLEGKFDSIFFESPQWGWEEIVEQNKLTFLGDVVLDGEVFISNISRKGSDDFFKDLKGKTIGLYLGYHYKFANFNSDEHYLKANFNAFVSSSHDRNIERIINNRLDMAIVTKSYIKKYLLDHPDTKSKIYISSVVDQDYRLKFGIRKSINFEESKMKKIIDEFLSSPTYHEIIKKYGLE
ncbi:ABC transporter, substrate-binding protein, family 3 [Bacteriovorax sp. Seq25_V]|nr:ABC transporter, substrate-binding protein, family 3 [Bacteriovorax sp. Seq25_V]